MAQRDVEIKIRARDDASGRVKKISDALKSLADDTEKASKGAGSANRAFSGLRKDLADLETQAARLKVFGTVASDISRAGQAVDTMSDKVSRSQRSFENLRADALRSSDALKELRASQEALASRLGVVRQRQAEITAQHKENREAVTRAKAALDAYNVSLAKTRNVGPAQASAGTFLRGDYKAATAASSAFTASTSTEAKRLRGEATSLSRELGALTPVLTSASRAHAALEGDVQKAGNALVAARADLHAEFQALVQLDDAARRAGLSTQNLSATQQQLARDAEKVAQRMETTRRAAEAMSKFSTGTGGFADPKTAAAMRAQVAVVENAKAEWAALTAEAGRLGTAMRQTSGNATTQVNAFNQVAGAAKAAKDEYLRQQRAMMQTNGTTKSSFLAFSQAATAANRSAAQSTAALAGATQNATGQQTRLAPMIQRTGQAAQQAAGTTRQFGGALLGLNGDTRQTLSLMQRLRGEVLSITASFIGLYAATNQVSQAINAFRDLEAVQSRLGAVFNQDVGRVAQEINWLRAEADRLGISFSVLGNQYGKFAIAANQAGFSQENVRKMFISVAEAGRVNKLSLDQLNGTFLAIEQIISKGKFTSEEVRRQLGDRLPGAFNILADAMGMTTAELDKMMSQGDLLATEGNLLAFTDQMSKRFGPQLSSSLDTLSTDIGRFENDVFKASLALAEGFVPALRLSLQAFSAFSNSAEGQEFFTQLGDLAGRAIGILGQVPQYFNEIKLAATALVALKVGGWVLGIANNVMAMRGSFVSVNQMMANTIQTGQRLSLAQRTVGLRFAQVTTSIGSYRAALLASTSTTALARAGTVGFAATLGGLQVAMTLTANIARVMWSAIGGLPGILVTGILFALTSWISTTDEATTALSEHQRQLNAVRQAYERVGGAAKDWGKEVKYVTVSQAQANIQNLRDQIAEATEGMVGYSRLLRVAFQDSPDGDPLRQQAESVIELVTQLRDGKIELDAFISSLDSIAQNALDDQIRDVALRILDMANASQDGDVSLTRLQESLKESEAVLRLLTNSATEADRRLLGLADAGGEVDTALNDTSAIDDYTAAINKLKEAIPSLSAEMERLQEITDLNKTAFSAFMAAVNTGDFAKIGEALSLWGRGANELQTKAMMDQLGGPDSDVMKRIVYVEGGQSGNGPAESTARGIGQFTEGTWLAYFDRVFSSMATSWSREMKLSVRNQEKFALPILEAFTRDNQASLARAGVGVGATETYLAHFLGAGDAIKVLLANPDELASNIVKADSIRANPNVFKPGMTAGDLVAWSAKKMGGNSPLTSSGQTEAEIQSAKDAKDRADELERQANATRDRLAANEAELAQQELKNLGLERQAAIEAAVYEARKENSEISEADLQRITDHAAKMWDLENASRARELSEERVNQLYELRQQLLEQQAMLEQQGDLTGAQALKTELVGVNEQLTEAIDKSIAMWQAVGGPEADAAIAKLNTQKMSLKATSDQIILLGMNAQQFETLVGSGVDGLLSILDASAAAIARNENAFKAAGLAFAQFASDFLRQIGLMIAKQMLLNALAGMGGPMGAAATALGGKPGGVPTGHTGGLVGSRAIGSGNAIRPSWAPSAFTYHTGGLGGLRPDELSATLKRNEEILTEEDPRHRFNAGGETETAAAAQRAPQLKQVLAIGDDEIANAMQGASGERVTMTHIRRNKATIRRELGF